MRLSDLAISSIERLAPSNSPILELGSGFGTEILLNKGYELISIEQNKDWQFKYHDNYIAAPLKKYKDYWWFDSDYLAQIINLSYDFLLIDGPTGDPIPEFDNCRIGILDNLHFFNLSLPILVDDINRKDEKVIFNKLSKGRKSENFNDFGLIY